jgi:hypothetical protein
MITSRMSPPEILQGMAVGVHLHGEDWKVWVHEGKKV